jgi:ribosome-associated translation inhibitor RaiA
MPLRIEVIGADGVTTPQARAYAEYRLFATLARHMPAIRSVRVVLAQAKRNGRADRVTCAVTVVLYSAGSARARAQGPRAYSAIDRAAERIGDLLGRRAPQRISF